LEVVSSTFLAEFLARSLFRVRSRTLIIRLHYLPTSPAWLRMLLYKERVLTKCECRCFDDRLLPGATVRRIPVWRRLELRLDTAQIYRQLIVSPICNAVCAARKFASASGL
jgi:hypothetical protein